MRGKNYIFLFALILLSTGFVSSLEDFSCEDLESQKSILIGQTIPEKVPFKNEVMNLYLEEKIIGNLQVEGGKVSDLSCTGSEDATYNVHIQSLQVVNEFIESEDFLETYKEKSDSGEIIIEGIGLGKKIKLAFAKFFLRFA